jgi:hypothetical protein
MPGLGEREALYDLRMIFSEHRFPFFGIMRGPLVRPAAATGQMINA